MSTTNYTTVINNRIDEKGLDLETVAQRANISADRLSKALSGDGSLKAEDLVLLCQVLGLDFADFRKQ